jgi:hypothetical protein
MTRASLTGCGVLVLSGWLMSMAVDGGDVKPPDILKQVLDTLDKITTTLTTVQDEATAKAAVPELRKSVARFRELRGQADKAKPPSNEEGERLKKDYRQKLEAATKKMKREIERVKTVPGSAAALKEVTPLFKKDK